MSYVLGDAAMDDMANAMREAAGLPPLPAGAVLTDAETAARVASAKKSKQLTLVLGGVALAGLAYVLTR
jgi:hypothetical protein